jgi:hypothetical protein
LNIPDGEHRSLDWATRGEVKALGRHGGEQREDDREGGNEREKASAETKENEE